jgi:hypothetical protein
MPKPMDTRLSPFWVEDRGLSFFLEFLVLTYFCAHDSFVTVRANWIGSEFRIHAFLGCYRNDSPESPHISGRSATVLEFTSDLKVEFNASLGHLGWDTALKVSGMGILVVMTLRQTFRPGPISMHRVMVE